jgi:hypothetical protein
MTRRAECFTVDAGVRRKQPGVLARQLKLAFLSLINEVLDLSKIEAGKLELNPEPVNLARLIDEVIGTTSEPGKGSVFTVCLPGGA